MSDPSIRAASALTELIAQKDNAYRERNLCAIALAKLAVAAGYKAGIGRHSDDWDPVTVPTRTGDVVVSQCDVDLLTSPDYNWVSASNGYIRDTRNDFYLHDLIIDRMFPDHYNATGDFVPGIPEGYTTDHIDRNKPDNSRWNLRLATKRGQNLNKPWDSKGIEKHGAKFRAYTSIDGKKTVIGSFDDPLEAKRALEKRRADIMAAADTDGTYLYSRVGWERGWRNVVYVDLPTGQLSWHIHDTDLPAAEGLPTYADNWDGHSTEEKYRRMEAYLPAGSYDSPEAVALQGTIAAAVCGADERTLEQAFRLMPAGVRRRLAHLSYGTDGYGEPT